MLLCTWQNEKRHAHIVSIQALALRAYLSNKNKQNSHTKAKDNIIHNQQRRVTIANIST